MKLREDLERLSDEYGDPATAGCTTGDCPHATTNECYEALIVHIRDMAAAIQSVANGNTLSPGQVRAVCRCRMLPDDHVHLDEPA